MAETNYRNLKLLLVLDNTVVFPYHVCCHY